MGGWYLRTGIEVVDGGVFEDVEGGLVERLVDVSPPDLLLSDRVCDDSLLLWNSSENQPKKYPVRRPE